MLSDRHQDLIEDGDIAIFEIDSQSSSRDKASLLALQQVVRRQRPGYVYLEVGSHVGGSLFPHLVDDRCAAAVSVDPRPPSQPDERGRHFHYRDNSTARMIEILSEHAPRDSLSKLCTFDCDISAAPATEIPSVHLALIDGEHTNRAAFRDFMHVLPLTSQDGAIIAFHDANLLVDSLFNVCTVLEFAGRPYASFFLADVVFAVAIGQMAPAAEDRLRSMALDAERYYTASKENPVWPWLEQ